MTIAIDDITVGQGNGSVTPTHDGRASGSGGIQGVYVTAAGTGLTPGITSVSYGGVAVPEVTAGSASPNIVDGSLEDGYTLMYFVGSGLESVGGSQTVTITGTGGAPYSYAIYSFTSSTGTTEINDTDQHTATSGGGFQLDFVTTKEAQLVGAIWSSTNATSGISLGGGTSDQAVDFGNDCSRHSHNASPDAAGTPNLNWNGSTNGTHAYSGAAISEGDAVTPPSDAVVGIPWIEVP